MEHWYACIKSFETIDPVPLDHYGVFGLEHLYANNLGVKTDLKRGYILIATAQQLGSQA